MSTDKNQKENEYLLHILPLKDMVLFPHVVFPLAVEDAAFSEMINSALVNRTDLGIFTEAPNKNRQDVQIYKIGTRASILKMFQVPEGGTRLLLQGIERIKLADIIQQRPFLLANARPLATRRKDYTKCEASVRAIKTLLERLAFKSPVFSEEIVQPLFMESDHGKFVDLLASNLEINLAERQQLLEEELLDKRLEQLLEFVERELKVVEITGNIENRVSKQVDQSQKEYILREQLKAIREELGEQEGDEDDDWEEEVEDLRKQIKKAKMPPAVEKEALKELDRLLDMSPVAAEYTITRTYIDWLISLPWSKQTPDNMDLENAKKILDEDHHDLQDVKDRILEFLAIRTLKKDSKGPILCFAGPPGVGKTSLGRSIARCMGRKFVRYSVGGIRDEAEIRGHRRTYIGALPGRIIQMIKEAGTSNPVFMLDEIDKIGSDFRGDPASALLEALDPQQNKDFVDHYLDVKFDLSRVMFITTANVLYNIPHALLDRLEVIEIPGYITEEKIQIARKYLVPRQISESGLKKRNLKFHVAALEKIILDYTNEAGVRNLEREIARICRKVARKFAEGHGETIKVDTEAVAKYLGPPKNFTELAGLKDEVGIATGLAWTPAGGEILFVESTMMKGGKNLTLTGQLGEVMRESAQAALSYLRAHAGSYGFDPEFFSANDVHIHVPSGAVPKDGPSAGVTIATSLLSLLTGKPVRYDVAMTGEISLRGRVLPVGGIKEKVLAARRAGIRQIIIPRRNENDLQEVPENIRKKLKFLFVEKLREVFDIALRETELKKAPRRTKSANQKRSRNIRVPSQH
ncbi:MAG: endopeptidase La [Calditrichia bacterium]